MIWNYLHVGLILSSQGIGYSVGKLLGGVLVDLYSPSTLFTASLFMAGISVVAFTGKILSFYTFELVELIKNSVKR